MAFQIIRPADRQGWLAQREKGIGSSEVGTILGVNPWETFGDARKACHLA